MPKLMNKCSMRAEYGVTVITPSGKKEHYQADLLLDSFFAHLHTYLYGFQKVDIKVGTGTSIPDVSQTSLDNQLSYKRAFRATPADLPGAHDPVNNLITCERTYEAIWDIGAVTGNLTEVGASIDSNQSGTNFIHSRALFKDSEGNPTTIVVTAEDQLIVRWKVTLSYSSLDRVFTLNSGSIEHTVTMRPYALDYVTFQLMMGLGQYDWLIAGDGTSDLTPIGTTGYLNDSTQKSSNSTRVGTSLADRAQMDLGFNITVANFGITKAVTTFTNNPTFDDDGPWQFKFSPAIPKTEDDTLNLVFTAQYGRE